jgi:serine/threonine-protein kinase RIO1
MFSMQYLGTTEAPAPRLRDAVDEPMEPLARKTLAAVEHLVGSGVVHTDLSPYNILVDRGEPWIIDVGKCLRVDRLGSPPWETLHKARTAIEAGARNLARFFGSHGVTIDPQETAQRFFRQIERYELLTE